MLHSKIQYGSLIGALFLIVHVASPMHFSDFTNSAFRPQMHKDKRFEFALLAEHGFKTTSFDEEGCVANVLRIWNKDQNALKMLYGFPQDSKMGQLLIELGATDDGVRGHFCVHGNLESLYDASFGFRHRFLDDFIIGLYLPIRGMRLTNVSFADQTLDVQDQDIRVHELLTDNFVEKVKELGCLNICGWRRTGLGDLALLLEWMRDFPQPKPLLKNVQLKTRLGLSFPTGLKRDEDLLFALPFGTDGSLGVMFGAGLDLTLGEYVRTGLDVHLEQVFGSSKLRRIKTDKDQTDLLLLQKTCAYKDFGLNQQFTLYFEFYQFLKGLSLRANYQFTKHGEDILSLETQEFSTAIANTAISLQEWTAHYAILKATYDFGYDEEMETRVRPQLSLYTKVPFNGKHVALFTAAGVIFSLDF